MLNHCCDRARRSSVASSLLERATAGCALLTLSGCALNKAAPCDTPPPFFAKLEAEEKSNTDSKGQGLPTVVQFLQLKDSIKLERASFQKLWAEPKALLGEDLLQTVEFVVAPGDQVRHWMQRDPKARYVAAVGLFRQPLGNTWLAVAKLPPVPSSQCVEQPAGSREAEPSAQDTQLRFKIQNNKIDYLRPMKGTP